ncbi:uncharacterized protein DUF4056 [Acinetobacter calcoaceticus]|uniref:Uncharacterized protein DUF4056 n=1 Tax=Acinetobacter calcoaceticus TaxID=471 RepID=A0A4R1XG21_ACICA|nr:uncharacterized protein DUF4056 [Acinetobacter calcoaceticus]
MRFGGAAIFGLCSVVLLVACQHVPTVPTIKANISSDTQEQAKPHLQPPSAINQPPMPDGLRPCCAFGYDLKAKLAKVPVPFYKVNNVLDLEHLGRHRYNDSFWRGVSSVLSLSSEQLGMVYTRKGGFIDVAHVRDTADYSYYLFAQIYPRLGEAWTLKLSNELAERRIQFHAFSPPQTEAERYSMSVYLAAHLGYQLAVWHEIAQWYGYRSVPGFSEQISAFSPEDLYSNLLGARLAVTVLMQGQADSVKDFNRAMQGILPSALEQLDVQSAEKTRQVFDDINGTWWDKSQRVPEKFLVLKRHYVVASNRMPLLPEQETAVAHRLALPEVYAGYDLKTLASMQYWPTKKMAKLPIKDRPITTADFPMLLEQAEREASL